MSPVFSAPLFLQQPEHPQSAQPTVELQLLPTEELTSLWEQTQRAAWAMEEKGMEPGAPMYYSQLVVWEMQRRLSLHPGLCFAAPSLTDPADQRPSGAPEALPHIMAVRL